MALLYSGAVRDSSLFPSIIADTFSIPPTSCVVCALILLPFSPSTQRPRPLTRRLLSSFFPNLTLLQYLKRFRLIVHNLALQIGLEEVEQAFAKYGPLFEVKAPPPPQHKAKQQRNRGIAFVNYTNVNSARRVRTTDLLYPAVPSLPAGD